MIVHPDTTSGGSYRQNEHAGNTAMPTNRSSHQRRSIRESKINRLLYESPGLVAVLPGVRHRSALCALQRSDGVKEPLVDLRPPLPTMTARPIPQLPDERHSARPMFEPKLDGWRCLTFHRVRGGAALQSRQQSS